jgi:peptide/nickel transport system permease protein
MLGEKATDQICDAFMKRYGLDQPIPVQFVYYMGRVVTGDLGDSMRFGRRHSIIYMTTSRPPVSPSVLTAAGDHRDPNQPKGDLCTQADI